MTRPVEIAAARDMFGAIWRQAERDHPLARAIIDGRDGAAPHYSRQTPGAKDFLAPGQTFVLIADGAVWGVVRNLDMAGALRWRVAVFRREVGAPLPVASELIRAATRLTLEFWRRRHGGIPAEPLETEVDPTKTRHKRDPGRCFRRAGWTVTGERRGLVILRAPRGEP